MSGEESENCNGEGDGVDGETESTLINILKSTLVTEGLTALRKQSGM